MKKQSIPCPECSTPLTFRKWSKRQGEALASCPVHGKYQIRYFVLKGEYVFGEPYKTKIISEYSKSKHVSGRMTVKEYANVIEKFGSFQKMLDCFSAGVLHQQ